MSAQIDQRIVQMRFDNASFEKNVNQSIGTLDKLKQALSFDGVKNNLQNVFNNLTFNTFNNSITETEQKLNVFHELAVGIIRKIGEEISDKLVGGLKNAITQFNAFAQMGSGFSKYESAINSTQTIMATGKYQMDQVEDALSRLQWFADETSYSMNDMTQALSTLTSQGVELEDAVVAAQGIANWAAESGVSASRASSAFYNLGQAISAGALKMQDWKSIQLLSMNTPQFKKIAIAAAVAAGTLEDLGNGMYQVVGTAEQLSETQNFEASLSKGWLSSGVLMDTLEDYGKYSDELKKFMEDQKALGKAYGTSQDAMEDFDAYLKENNITIIENGRRAYEAGMSYRTWTDVVDATQDAISSAWSRMYTSIFGNLEEAKELWSVVGGFAYDTFAAKIVGIADAFEDWKRLGGRDQLLKGFSDIYDGIVKIKEIVGETFSGILPQNLGITWQKIMGISAGFKNFAENFKNGVNYYAEEIGIILSPLRQIALLLKLVGSQIKNGFGLAMRDIGSSNVSIWKKLLDIFVKIAGHISNFVSRLREAISRTYAFTRITKELVLTGKALWDTFKSLVAVVGSFVKGIAKAFGYEIGLDKTTDDVNGLTKVVGTLTNVIEKVLRSIRSALEIIGFSLGTVNDDAESMGEIVGSGLVIIWEKAKQVFKFIKDNIPTTAEEWAALPDKLWNKLKAFVADLPNKIGSLTELPGMFRQKMNELLADFPGAQEKFNNFCDKIAAAWDWLMQKFEKLKGITDDFGGFLKSIVEDFKNGFETKSLDDAETKIEKIGAVAGETVDKIKNFLGFGGDANETLNTASQTLDSVADSAEKATEKLGLFDKLAAIPGKLKEGLNQIDWKKIAEGIGLVFSGTVIASIAKLLYGLGALPLGITKMFNSFAGFMDKTGKGVEKFLTSAGVGLTNLSQGAKQLMKGKARKMTADALLEIAIALGILVGVCIILSKQDFDAMIKAASIMLIFMFALEKIIGKVAKFNTGALAIFGLGIAIIQIVKAVGMMGKMDEAQVGKGIASLLVILMALSKVMAQFNKVKDNGKEFKIGDALLLVAMGKAVQMMMTAVKDMADAYAVSDSGAILGIVTILATMFSMAFVMRQFEHVDKGVIKGSIGMLILAKAASTIIMSLGVLAEATYNDSTAAVSVISTIMIVMLGLLGMLAIFGHSDSMAKRAISTGIAIYLIGSAIAKMMKGMAVAMQAAGNISKDSNASTEEKANATWAPVAAIIGALIGVAVLVASFKGVSAKTLVASTTMFTSLATSILIIMGSIAILAYVMKGADSKFLDSFNMVVGTIMGIFAIFTLLMFVLTRNKNVNVDNQTKTLTVSVPLMALSLGIAVLAIAKAIELISNIKLTSALAAAGILTGMMVVMGVVVILIKKFASGEDGIKGVSGTLLGMAAALVIMSVGCRLLATADSGAIVAAGAALSMMALAMAGVILIISKAKIGGKKGAGTILLMLGMAAAVFLVAASLRMLVDSDPKSILAAAAAITILLVAFTGLGLIAAVVPGAKEGLIAISTAFVTFSVGILALAASILVLETAAIMFKKICESFGNAGPELEKGIERIKKVMPEFADAFVIFITSLTGGLLETLPILVGQLATALISSLKALVEVIPDIVYILGMLLLGILTGLNVWAQENHDQIVKQIYDLLVNIFTIVRDVLFEIMMGIGDWFDEQYGDEIQSIFGFVDEIVTHISNFFIAGYNAVVDFIKWIGKGILAGWEAIKAFPGKVVDGVHWVVDKIKNFASDAWNAVVDFVQGILDGFVDVAVDVWNAAAGFATTVIDAIKSVFVKDTAVSKVAENIPAQSIAGISKGTRDNLNTVRKEGEKVGVEYYQGARDGLRSKSPSKEFIDIAKDSVAGLSIGTDQNLDVASTAGESIGSSFLGGLSGVGEKVKNGIMDFFGIDSETLSNPLSGLTDMFSLDNLGLDSLGSSLTDSLKLDELIPNTDSLTEGLGSLDGLYDTESLFDDTNPVITPVMDLSEIQNGTDEMDSMFSSVDASYVPNGAPSYVSTSQKLADDTAYTAQQNQQAKLDSYNNLYKALNNSGADMSTTEFVNTFNISGNSDPHAVAEEVAAVLQNQVEKKKLAWR